MVFAGNHRLTGELLALISKIGNPEVFRQRHLARRSEGLTVKSSVTRSKDSSMSTAFVNRHDQSRTVPFLISHTSQTDVAQFSSARFRTRRNSRVLFVTKVRPRQRAWAAMNRSLAPIMVPCFLRSARIVA